jgi:P27 family predicted phage terminase small subunit
VRGRKPRPTALKVLEGNPGKRPLNRREPQPSVGAPGCPDWLPREAKAEWRRVVSELDRIGMLKKVDRAALATYCEAWSILVAAEALIAEHGLMILQFETQSVDGARIYVRPVKNPAVLIAKDASATIRAFAAEFGLTPSSRTRLTVPHEEETLEQILGRRRAEREEARKQGG